MRWTAKPREKLIKGATRTIGGFAWFPTRLDTDQWVWLERYWKMQVCELRVRDSWPLPYLDWDTDKKLPTEPKHGDWFSA